MPMPVSSTSSTTAPSATHIRTVTEPPPGVNFFSLPRRLWRTCKSRSASPSTMRSRADHSQRRSIPLASAVGRIASSASAKDGVDRDRTEPHLHLAQNHRRHLEHVLDEPRLDPRISIDHLESALQIALGHTLAADENCVPPQHGIERGAQLVTPGRPGIRPSPDWRPPPFGRRPRPTASRQPPDGRATRGRYPASPPRRQAHRGPA